MSNVAKARFSRNTPLDQRLLARSELRGDCWIWVGCTSHGYGNIRFCGKTLLVHRVAYELWVGEVPEDLFVCHECDERACFNPEHLWLGTNEQNCADMVEKGRSARGVLQYNHKLSEVKVAEIRTAYASGLISQRQLSREYGVDQGCISRIVNRHYWKHVGGVL